MESPAELARRGEVQRGRGARGRRCADVAPAFSPQALLGRVVRHAVAARAGGRPDPSRALREIHRVLAPGGRYLGVERASPWLAPFAAPEARALDARALRQGTRERAIRYREWQAILDEAGLGAACLAPVPGERVGAPWLRRLGNAARQIYVTIRVTR